MKRRIPFTKMHGAGNDFVLVDSRRHPVRMTAALARRFCDRRFGVGADQVLVLEKSTGADYRMLIYNADGSQVEMCGNGIRCLARYIWDRIPGKSGELRIETLAGIKRTSRTRRGVRVDMGSPVLDAARIPTRAKGRVIERPVPPGTGAPRALAMTCVSMGNPHAVFFVKEVAAVPLDVWGPRIENASFFPRRTNVEFVEVLSPDHARVRVWERGSGATLACGTGACAVGVAGVLTGRFHRLVRLTLPGGDLHVEWAADDHVYLTGPAVTVFDGVLS